jgi:hypothetical protein
MWKRNLTLLFLSYGAMPRKIAENSTVCKYIVFPVINLCFPSNFFITSTRVVSRGVSIPENEARPCVEVSVVTALLYRRSTA